jgi:hypothetical protein
MLNNQKYIFLYALIATLFIFNLGIFMGYMLESSRADKISAFYSASEMKIFDQMAQKEAMNLLIFDCDSLSKENIKFGNEIYTDALTIQKYEDANRIDSEIISLHKKFDSLRALFWMNSLSIKQKCNFNYHIAVYFYKYNSPSLEQQSKQKFFSNVLLEAKEKFGDKIMLIPIAADNDIPSISLLLEKYQINEFPTILMDENAKITEIKNMSDIEKYLI